MIKKIDRKKAADKNSKRSKSRVKRGFESLEKSCRKHRRALKRLTIACTHYGKVGEPGDRMTGESGSFVHIAGGGIHYH